MFLFLRWCFDVIGCGGNVVVFITLNGDCVVGTWRGRESQSRIVLNCVTRTKGCCGHEKSRVGLGLLKEKDVSLCSVCSYLLFHEGGCVVSTFISKRKKRKEIGTKVID